MEGMIDIHNHTLFGVDDGSKDIEQSKRMLEIAYKEGIRGIILTPHYNPYRWQNKVSDLMIRFNQLNAFCMDKYSDMKLYLGNELYYGKDTLKHLDSGMAMTMAQGKYVLAEFSTAVSFSDIRHAIMDIQQSGYYPIIAHVERYECLLKNTDYIDEMIELGAFIQVNASSVLGEHGRLEKKFVRELLKHECVDFVATDAHRDNMRVPLLKKCADYIVRHYGAEYAFKMFIDNPFHIINNQYIEE
ncbi:MAG: protein tyrosine phosphatase [Lachnospiraceae bacterium]|nr:protein tyrosine phosphatase [Lachnospiraceae bacterium]